MKNPLKNRFVATIFPLIGLIVFFRANIESEKMVIPWELPVYIGLGALFRDFGADSNGGDGGDGGDGGGGCGGGE